MNKQYVIQLSISCAIIIIEVFIFTVYAGIVRFENNRFLMNRQLQDNEMIEKIGETCANGFDRITVNPNKETFMITCN